MRVRACVHARATDQVALQRTATLETAVYTKWGETAKLVLQLQRRIARHPQTGSA